jgi:PiT family inorganic phosphate transporter
MTLEYAGLLVASAAFALISGANDGGTLLTVALKMRSLPPFLAMGLLVVALVLAPIVLGTGVATTLASRLVSFEGSLGRSALFVAVVAAVAVVGALSALGLPTSLILALIGGITGAGIGDQLPIAWGTLALVLVAGLAAPAIGAAVGWVLMRLAARLRLPYEVADQLGWGHRLAYVLICVAYATNGGQKMLAIAAVAIGIAAPTVQADGLVLLVIGGFFALGVVLGLPRLSETLSRGVTLMRPAQGVAAELAAAIAVFVSTAAGSPVSMTQSLTGALVGSGASQGYRRIRWRTATRLGMAWVVTLPASAGVAAIIAGWLRGGL